LFCNRLALTLTASLAVSLTSGQSRRARPPAPQLSAPKGVQALVQLEKSILEAIREKDVDTLGGILAADFVYVSPRKRDMMKQEFLRHVKTFPHEIEWLGAEEMMIHMYGDIAVVTGVQDARIRSEKTGVQSEDTAFTDVFRKNNGEWQLVLAFGVDIPSTPAKK
jgi:ketosteroid isomerase-like protein